MIYHSASCSTRVPALVASLRTEQSSTPPRERGGGPGDNRSCSALLPPGLVFADTSAPHVLKCLQRPKRRCWSCLSVLLGSRYRGGIPPPPGPSQHPLTCLKLIQEPSVCVPGRRCLEHGQALATVGAAEQTEGTNSSARQLLRSLFWWTIRCYHAARGIHLPAATLDGYRGTHAAPAPSPRPTVCSHILGIPGDPPKQGRGAAEDRAPCRASPCSGSRTPHTINTIGNKKTKETTSVVSSFPFVS